MQGYQGLHGQPGLPGWFNNINISDVKIIYDETLIGPSGPIGSEGPTGPVGPIGPVGQIGFQGLQGLIGAEGIQGIKGEIGPVGDNGIDGKKYDIKYTCKNFIAVDVPTKQYTCTNMYPILADIDYDYNRVKCCQIYL